MTELRDFEEGLIERGWYIFPQVQGNKIPREAWECIRRSFVDDIEYYVCHAISHLGYDSTFILDGMELDTEVTNWHSKRIGVFMQDAFPEYFTSNLYRILWIDNILENYNN